jgi:hypothetical protein
MRGRVRNKNRIKGDVECPLNPEGPFGRKSWSYSPSV